MNTKTALVTGATSGIGQAIARLLSKNNCRLVLCGRRQERLDELTRELSAHTECHTLNFDVRDREAVFAAINSLPQSFSQVDVLVNNAGNAHGRGSIAEGDLDDWDMMIDGNVKGLLYVTKAILGQMIDRKKGFILNIGSIAGINTYPDGNVYCASKSAVATLSEAMRIDLFRHGIRVSEIKPGLVETEFSEVRFKGDKDTASRVYQGYAPLQAEDVADLALFMLTRPPHVNVADVLILPADQASSTLVNRHDN